MSDTPPPEEPHYEPPAGSAMQLADEPVDPARAALVYAAAFVLLAAAAWPALHLLFGTYDGEPDGLADLRRAADVEVRTEAPRRRAVVVLVDGLRFDEAEAMPAVGALSRRGAFGSVLHTTPTRSRPGYHVLFTGVPPDGSGVRSNRYEGPARLDSLADRVRAAGGTCAWVGEDLDWLAELFAAEGETVEAGPDALGAPLARVLGEGATLTVVHVLAVDETAHEGGVRSAEHAQALEAASALIGRLAEAADETTLFALISDHGHIDGGGHGGLEREVARVPFVLVAPGLEPGERRGVVEAAAVAPTLAAWLEVPPPRTSVAPPAPAYGVSGGAQTARAMQRAVLVAAGSAKDRRRLADRQSLSGLLWFLLAVSALGATKRAFTGFDRGTLIAPALFVALGLAAHVLLERPFSLSAVDTAWRHALRFGTVGALAAAASLGAAAAVRRRPGSGGALALFRAAAALGFVCGAAALGSLAWLGGAMGPWPLAELEAYAPVLSFTLGAGAWLVCAAVLAGVAWRSRAAPDMKAPRSNQSTR